MTLILRVTAGCFALAVVAGVLLQPCAGFAQGYPGLIPDNSPVTPKNKNDEPLGYEGLIPGRIPERPKPAPAVVPAPAPTPTADIPPAPDAGPATDVVREQAPPGAPQIDPEQAMSLMTPIPDGTEWLKTTPQPLDKLKEIARASGFGQEAEKVPPEVVALGDKMITDSMRRKLERPREKDANGMTPHEVLIQRDIDKTLALAANTKMPSEERRQKLAKAISGLAASARVLHLKAGTPDNIYKMFGLPDAFMNDQRESSKRSLQRIQAAFEELRKYQ